MNRRQRERKTMRARFHSVMQSRKARREERDAPVDESVFNDATVLDTPVGVVAVKRPKVGARLTYEADSNAAWEAAKRRRQSKLKTWALWQDKLEGMGYFFRSEGDTLHVYKGGIEVGTVKMFGAGPDA